MEKIKEKSSLKYDRYLWICAIILLLVGLSVTSSIGGYIGKMGNQSTIEVPADSSLNNDYVNGYWKFDEGEGNIAYDSSGHGYHGTIYGATWVGQPGDAALDFDGLNDYVDLDPYAKNQLGFNKTDDLIFSVYFNSTSDGIIYSVSKSDSYNPGVHISINQNGTIEFKLWKSNCGISLSSMDAYNDGLWHHCEIFYNGISADPIASIYVDGELDNSIEHWVCFFYADQFDKAKIGKNAYNSTGYFDGVIDEFKIIKYPGGNQPPDKPDIDGPTFGLIDEKLTYSFVVTDLEEDDFWCQIDWGDGDITQWIGPKKYGEVITRTHSWSENGTYNITARSKDFWNLGSWSDPFLVSIGSHAPETPEQPSGPTRGSTDIEYTYSSSTTDIEDDPIWYMFDWGDGNFSNWLGPYNSGDTVEASYAWREPGEYDVMVKAKDELGESYWSEPLNVSIVISALEIGKITGGLLRVNIAIKNIGEWEATDVSWNIDLVGGSIFIGRNSSGEISGIPALGKKTVSSKVILGLGKVVVAVTAKASDGSHAEKERDAFVLLFFIV